MDSGRGERVPLASGLLIHLNESVRSSSSSLASRCSGVIENLPPSTGPPAPGQSDLKSTASQTQSRRILTSHTSSFVQLLAEMKVSLLISTYQGGKVAVVQSRGDELLITYHNFERPMGVAVSAEQLAIGTNTQVWFLVHAPQIAQAIAGGKRHDSCYLTRGSHFTGEIHGHEMEWSGRELWVVNTLFSCLCTIGASHNFIPRWKPRFVSTLAAEDRCHLNGLAMENGRPRYITCLGETDTIRGWRKTRRQAAASSICPPGKRCFGDYRCPILPAFTEVTSGSWNQVADA